MRGVTTAMTARTYPLVRALLRPVARTLPRRALVAAGTLGLLLAAVPRLYDRPDTALGLTVLRTAALAFALGVAFLCDDPARHTTATVPTRRAVRGTLRVALLAPCAVLWWTAALLLVPAGARPPVGAVTLEAASLAMLALAAATAAAWLRDEPEPGRAVAGALLALTTVTALLPPERWGLFVALGNPHWEPAHQRWAAVLAVAVLCWACCVGEAFSSAGRWSTGRFVLRFPSAASGRTRT